MISESGAEQCFEGKKTSGELREHLESLIVKLLEGQPPKDNSFTEKLSFPPLPVQTIEAWKQRYPTRHDFSIKSAEIGLNWHPSGKLVQENRGGWLRKKTTTVVDTPDYKSVSIRVKSNEFPSGKYIERIYYLGLTSGKLPEHIASEFVVKPLSGPAGTERWDRIDGIRRLILPGDPFGDVEAFANLLQEILPFEQARKIINASV